MSRRKQILGLALLVGLMALTGFLLLRDQPVATLLETLSRIHPGYVLAGLGLVVLYEGCEAMSTRLILGRMG